MPLLTLTYSPVTASRLLHSGEGHYRWRMIVVATVLLLCPASTLPTTAQQSCPMVAVLMERLPDLNVSRAGHSVMTVNGEVTVFGGHTTGFVPTPTAEYFKDGEWHVVQMVYNHDFGGSVALKNGKVLLFGGCAEPVGIGQTYLAELYDPQPHAFNGFGCMDQKRAAASALELDSGKVVIAGNWYHDDSIELFDGLQHFTYKRDAAVNRSGPFIFQTAKDDAFIFSGFDNKGDSLHSSIADRLRGAPVNIPLFETWHPFCCMLHRSAESFIGNAAKGLFAYLLPVRDNAGQVAIAKIENGDVSLLPTACPVPMKTQWGGVEYYSSIIADQERGRAYLVGANADFRIHPADGIRHYVLRIDYAEAVEGKPAPLTLYYTDPMQDIPDYTPILTPEGNLLIAGGLTTELSNFAPSGHAYVLHIGDSKANLSTSTGNNNIWWWATLAVVIGTASALLTYKYRQRKKSIRTEISTPTTTIGDAAPDTDLMRRINELMENEKPFLSSELKVSDIADVFHLHRNDISACINSQMGCTFAQYVNRYRIDYAKQLMRRQPDKKIASVWMESGFGSEQTFFKTFRAATDLSPKEWIQQEND